MAAAAFSIRGFAASMRDEQAAEGRRPLGIQDLPPMKAPKFRWWADELASAVAAAAAAPSPRRSKPPKKKRSISDLFAAAPPMPPSDESEEIGVEDDEALSAIAKRAKEEKKRKRRLEGEEEEEAAAVAGASAVASAEGSGLREAEGNSETRKEAPEDPNLPDIQSSQKPEASQHLRKEIENISMRRKLEKINKTKKMKRADTPKCIDSNKVDKVGKPQDLENRLPRQSILKFTKLTSVKMVTETHSNSTSKEVIEVCRKAVKRVKFSEADDILGSEMESSELANSKRRSIHKLLSDAMASSSSSSSSSSMSTEGNKCIPAESSSSHMPKEAFTKTKEANQNPGHEDSPEPSNTELSSPNTELSSPLPEPGNTELCSPLPEPGNTELCSPLPEPGNTELSSHLPEPSDTELSSHLPEPSHTELPSHLFDLNMALPECTDLKYTLYSNSEAPNLQHAREENLNSDVQFLDGRENQRNLSFDSHRLASQLPVSDLESVRNARSAGSQLQGEPLEVSGIDIGPPLSLRELGETHHDCRNVSVKYIRSTSMSSCALPDHTFQDPHQQHQNGVHTNLNLGGSQLTTSRTFQDSHQQHRNGFHTNLYHGGSQFSTSGKFPLGASRELNVQRDCSPSVGQTFRLMGKDLAVCTSRDEAETTQKHTCTSSNDSLKTNASSDLPRQGQPFLSLQARSLPNVTVNATSTIPASTSHSGTSQAHLGYRTLHDFSHPIPAANVFSGDRPPYESRFMDFSNPQSNQPFLLGCPPPLNHHSAAPHQNPASPWRYYSVPISREEPPTPPFWPKTRQQGTPSSAFHGSSPQHHIVHSTSSSVSPLNSVSPTFSHPARVVEGASNIIRDAALSSRNPENRMERAVPGNSNASSSGRYGQKRPGPVKLTPGLKHRLVPSKSTGDSNSVPVYSSHPFGSSSGNAGASQNKGA